MAGVSLPITNLFKNFLDCEEKTMRGLVTGVEQFFWTMVWIFIALIAGYFILAFLKNKDIPVLSNVASWVNAHAEPQA